MQKFMLLKRDEVFSIPAMMALEHFFSKVLRLDGALAAMDFSLPPGTGFQGTLLTMVL